MPTVFGVQPMPTASFMKYTNEAATDKEVDTVLKIKQEKDKDELKRQELLLKGMKSVQDVITAQDSVFNLKPYTAFQQEQSKLATGHVNDYINRVKSMGESGEMDAVELAQAQLELSQKLNDPNIKTFVRESTQLGNLQDIMFKDKNGVYDPDAANEYLAELAPVNTPLDKIDYSRFMNVPLDETVATIVKGATYEGANEFGRIQGTDSAADVEYEIINGKLIKDTIIAKANQSPSFRNKILKSKKTVDEYADDIIKARTANAQLIGDGVYKVRKKTSTSNIKFPDAASPTSAGTASSDGTTTKATDNFKYKETSDNQLDNLQSESPSQSVNPGTSSVNYYSSLSGNSKDIDAKTTAINEQLKQYSSFTGADGAMHYGKLVPGTNNFVVDNDNNPISFDEDFNSLMNANTVQYIMKGNLDKTKKEIDAAMELKFPGFSKATKKFEDNMPDFETWKIKNTKVIRDSESKTTTKFVPTIEEYNKWRAGDHPEIKNLFPQYKEAVKYREQLAKDRIGVNSYSPSLIIPDTADYDYKTIIAPLQNGVALTRNDMTVIDGNSNILSPEQVKEYQDADLEIIGIVQDPYSGKYMYKLQKYTPQMGGAKGNTKEENKDEGSKGRHQYAIASYDKGGPIYAYNPKLQEMMFDTLANNKTDQGQSAAWIRNQVTTMFNQIEKTGIAYYPPGQLDAEEISITNNSSDPNTFDMYIKENGVTKVRNYSHDEISKVFSYFKDKKALIESQKQVVNESKGYSPTKINPETNQPYIDPKKIAANTKIASTVDGIYTMLSKGEGHADGTPNPNSSNDKLGTTGDIQVWRGWEKMITGEKAIPGTKTSVVYAKSWDDFKASPAAQKKFFEEVLLPDSNKALNKAVEVANTKWGKTYFENLSRDLKRYYKVDVNFLVETERGMRLDEDLIRYMAHNMGGANLIDTFRKGTISNDRTDNKLEQIATGLPKINNYRNRTDGNYLVSANNYLIRPAQGGDDELINFRHKDDLNKLLSADKKFVLSDGYRMKEETTGAEFSAHKDGRGYDISLLNQGISVDANNDPGGANKKALQALVDEKLPKTKLPANIKLLEVHAFKKKDGTLGNYHIHIEFKN